MLIPTNTKRTITREEAESLLLERTGEKISRLCTASHDAWGTGVKYEVELHPGNELWHDELFITDVGDRVVWRYDLDNKTLCHRGFGGQWVFWAKLGREDEENV